MKEGGTVLRWVRVQRAVHPTVRGERRRRPHGQGYRDPTGRGALVFHARCRRLAALAGFPCLRRGRRGRLSVRSMIKFWSRPGRSPSSRPETASGWIARRMGGVPCGIPSERLSSCARPDPRPRRWGRCRRVLPMFPGWGAGRRPRGCAAPEEAAIGISSSLCQSGRSGAGNFPPSPRPPVGYAFRPPTSASSEAHLLRRKRAAGHRAGWAPSAASLESKGLAKP